MDNIAKNKQIVLEFFDALFKGNLEAAQAAVADDAVLWMVGSLPTSGTYRGKSAIFGDFFGAIFPRTVPGSAKVEIQHVTAEEKTVILEVVISARLVTGKDYRNHYVWVFEVQGGKITAIRDYPDTLYGKEVFWSE